MVGVVEWMLSFVCVRKSMVLKSSPVRIETLAGVIDKYNLLTGALIRLNMVILALKISQTLGVLDITQKDVAKSPT